METMSHEERIEVAKQYVDKQLETMKKYGSAPDNISEHERKSLVEEVASALQLTKNGHWTADSPLRMVRSISSDFVAQLETVMEDSGCSYVELAKRLGVTMGRVSQMMNSPGNFTLKNGVLYGAAVRMNVAVVAYPMECTTAPISGDVFRACWEIAGRPKNMFDIKERQKKPYRG